MIHTYLIRGEDMSCKHLFHSCSTVGLTVGLAVALGTAIPLVSFAEPGQDAADTSETAAASVDTSYTPTETAGSSYASQPAQTTGAQQDAATSEDPAQGDAVEASDTEDSESIEDLALKNKGTLADGTTYVFVAGNAHRRVLDVAGGSTSNGANVQLYASNMSKAQLWKVHEDENGYLTFECMGSGLVLDVSGGKAEAGRNIQQYRSNGTLAQKWIAVKDDDGSIVLHSAIDFDFVVDIAGGSSANGANVQLYKANGTAAQSFMAYGGLVDVESSERSVEDGVYFFESSGSAMDVPGASTAAGTGLQPYGKNETLAQAFRVTYDERSGFYTIASLVSGRLLDADCGSVVPGGDVHLYGSLDDPSSFSKYRLWVAVSIDGGIAFRNVSNGLYLAFDGNSAVTASGPAPWTLTKTTTFTWTSADVDAFAAEHAGEIADGTYALCMSASSHSVLDVAGGSKSSGTNVQICGSNNTNAQRWDIKNVLASDGSPTGYVTIYRAGTSLALDVSAGYKSSGANVQQYVSNGTAAQKWVPVKQSDGTFVFYSGLGRSLVLDVSAGSTSNGANVQIWKANGSKAQSFAAVNAHPSVSAGSQTVADGIYQISSLADQSKCFDVTSGSTSNGARVQTYAANGTLAQGFKVTFDANSGFYSIRNVRTGKGLDLDSGDIIPGGKVQQWDYPGAGKNQLWRIEETDGSYVIRSTASNLVLERCSNGSLTTAVENGSAAQRWSFGDFKIALVEGCYSIYSASANKYVDVAGGSYKEGAPLQVYTGNGTLAQKFWARKTSDGYYTFQCVNSAKYLSARRADGGMAQIGSADSDEAKWSLEVNFGRGIALKNKQTGKVLSLSGSSGSIYALAENGSAGQAWSFNTTPVVPEGFYELAPANAYGSRADISGGSRANGANAQIYASNGSLSQRFWIRSVGSGWYSLTACCSAFPLDVKDCSSSDGANVQQWPWNGSVAQKWRFEMGEKGIKVISACGNKVLDVFGGGTANGTNLQIWSYNGSAAQGWRMIPADRPAKIGYQNPSNYPQVSSLTVRLPSYCTGEFTYVTPSRIAIDATRDDCINAFIQRAYEYIGTQYIEPYSTAPGGAVDCSGFVLQCLYATGMDMGIYNPYNHRWQAWQTYNSMNWYHNGTFMPVSVNAMQRGDVIYYRGHIAIYLGGGRMIDSWPRQGVGIHGVYERGNPIGAARPFV